MKILFVHDLLGPLGGAEANLSQVATGLEAGGDHLALLFGERTPQASGSWSLPFESVFGWQDEGPKAAVGAALRWKPDVIYVHHLSNLDILDAIVRSGVPTVRMVHDHHLFCQRGSRYFPWNRKVCTRKAGYGCALTCSVVRNRPGSSMPFRLAWPGTKLHEIELCQRFHRLIVQTDYMKSELTLHGFRKDQIRILPVIPAGEDETRNPPPGEGSDSDPPLILFVGQVIRGKGVDFLLRALKRIEGTDWACGIAGDGNHLKHCRRLCRRLGLDDRVKFHGRLDRSELSTLTDRARLGVVPSVWPEPMGMVGLEFMARGLPVVAFDVGGISDWLADGETGFLVPPRDTSNLAIKIEQLLTDEALARNLGNRGLEQARERFRFDTYLTDLRRLLEEAAGRVPEITPIPLPAIS